MILVNGKSSGEISVLDRGLTYGDGVFRTLLLSQGRPLCWRRHLAKLQHDCSALGISCPSPELLHAEASQLAEKVSNGVLKIIITRGITTRGYGIAATNPTRILSVHARPVYPDDYAERGVKVHLCQLRLSHQARLAGIKHLNRLENVLAASEWQDAGIAEGILSDEADWIISGTRSNLFLVKDGVLLTPDLTQCGVAGVQRARVMDWASRHGIPCRMDRIRMADLMNADEVFLVNSVFGLWPVREMGNYRRSTFPFSARIRNDLNDETD